MAAIELEGISKSFGATSVLQELNLGIREGEFLTLVGPSGCGKSTLLRIIAGLEDPSGGSVVINDRLVNGVRASERDLAMVFQSYALYPHLTVKRNMETPLRLRRSAAVHRIPILKHAMPSYRARNREIEAQVMDVASTLKIEHLLERKPGQLSGGQRQRVALGRAMVRNPVAFLMDEPLSNLDAALRVHMRSELSQLHRSLGTTFIYVTHDQAEALTMSDRMAVMLNGRIVQLGTPDEVYQYPVTREVARFVGSPAMNLVPVSDNQSDASHIRGIDPILSPLPSGLFGGVGEVGVRAEDLSLIAQVGKHDADLVWPVEISHKENLGSEGYLHAVVAGTGDILIAKVSTQEQRAVSVGQTAYFGCRLEQVHRFDEQGHRLSSQNGNRARDAVEGGRSEASASVAA